MTLTASGGPFRTWTAEQNRRRPRVDQALAHPNWAMGYKVTIDSAGLINKGLELIEAHHLFGIAADKLDVVVHPQSVVHGLVSFADGVRHGRLGAARHAGTDRPLPDLPAQDRERCQEARPDDGRNPDLRSTGTSSVSPASGWRSTPWRQGRGLPTVLNAANEVAVEAFVGRRIGFSDIARIVQRVCDAMLGDGTARTPTGIAEAMAVDHVARERAAALLD